MPSPIRSRIRRQQRKPCAASRWRAMIPCGISAPMRIGRIRLIDRPGVAYTLPGADGDLSGEDPDSRLCAALDKASAPSGGPPGGVSLRLRLDACRLSPRRGGCYCPSAMGGLPADAAAAPDALLASPAGGGWERTISGYPCPFEWDRSGRGGPAAGKCAGALPALKLALRHGSRGYRDFLLPSDTPLGRYRLIVMVSRSMGSAEFLTLDTIEVRP